MDFMKVALKAWLHQPSTAAAAWLHTSALLQGGVAVIFLPLSRLFMQAAASHHDATLLC